MVRDALSEIVGPPPGGRIFELQTRTGFADCAPSGRIRLDALARWLQDIAYADVEDAGLAGMAVWVVRRTRIRVRRFPRFGERFSLATFCSGLGRMWGERRTTVRRPGEADSDVEAVALWVHLDPVDWRPVPFYEREAELYGSAAAGRRVSARLRHPAPDPAAPSSTWTFRSVDLDIAGHVNNSAYWQPLEEELLSGPEPQQIDVEIEFRTPCQPGVKQLVRNGTRRWILGDGEAHASLHVAELVSGSARVKKLHGAAMGQVGASPAACVRLLGDAAGYPEWYPEVVREVEVLRLGTADDPALARTTLHAHLGPLEHDFSFVVEVSRQGLEIVRLARIPNEPGDPERLTLLWLIAAGAGTELAVELDALLDVPRLLPLHGAGDSVARGFLAAARRALGDE